MIQNSKKEPTKKEKVKAYTIAAVQLVLAVFVLVVCFLAFFQKIDFKNIGGFAVAAIFAALLISYFSIHTLSEFKIDGKLNVKMTLLISIYILGIIAGIVINILSLTVF